MRGPKSQEGRKEAWKTADVSGIRNLESEASATWTRGFHRRSRMGARLDRARGVSEIKGKWRVWTTLVKFYKCSGNREKQTETKGRCELISGGEQGMA